jgi:hypothetical protein
MDPSIDKAVKCITKNQFFESNASAGKYSSAKHERVGWSWCSGSQQRMLLQNGPCPQAKENNLCKDAYE